MSNTLADQIKLAIDLQCANQYAEAHRTHLGASVIGHECSRYVWSHFRWLKLEAFPARMLRIFNRGHTYETKIIEWLSTVDWITVYHIDTIANEQIRFSDEKLLGHYGGATDLIIDVSPNRFIGEIKTHNQRSYLHLLKHKLVIGKPRHYAQMCAYGKAFNINYGIYIAINMNDMDIYVEVVELDFAYAEDLRAKAFDVITSKVPPQKISMQDTYFECKICPFTDNCQHAHLPDRNCRSCTNATAIAGSQWRCERYNAIIPKEFIPQGCDAWDPIA